MKLSLRLLFLSALAAAAAYGGPDTATLWIAAVPVDKADSLRASLAVFKGVDLPKDGRNLITSDADQVAAFVAAAAKGGCEFTGIDRSPDGETVPLMAGLDYDTGAFFRVRRFVQPNQAGIAVSYDTWASRAKAPKTVDFTLTSDSSLTHCYLAGEHTGSVLLQRAGDRYLIVAVSVR